MDASKREPTPAPTHASALTYSYQLPWAPEQARDVLSPGVLLRNEGMFRHPRFNQSTMVEVGQLIYDDAFGFAYPQSRNGANGTNGSAPPNY
jgi:hypothetical protein